MNDRYYYSTTGSDVLGPLPLSEIGSAIKNNTMTSDTMVCKEGEEKWTRYIAVVNRMNSRKNHLPARHLVKKKHDSLSGSKHFTVYHHPVYGYKAVKTGFSWPAFLFAPVWVLVKRLWLVACGLFFAAFILTTMADAGLYFLSRVLVVPIGLLVGIYGNEMAESKLLARGFKKVDHVYASTPDAALAKVARQNLNPSFNPS